MVERKLSSAPEWRVGIDENGLGPLLGPLVVTAVLASVEERGARRFRRKLPESLRADLDDSKVLVSSRKIALAEAWARVVVERTTKSKVRAPADILRALSLQNARQLRSDCPTSTEAQCFHTKGESFVAEQQEIERIDRQFTRLEGMGVAVRSVRSEVVCVGRLNALKERGIHRFSADLHCMERLVLHLRELCSGPLIATCGKVGGITKYEPFWGPLSGRLFTTIEEQRARSRYSFPHIGEVRFVRDADALDPLVMLSSLIGKYLRELMMGRISRFYAGQTEDQCAHPSGYHDSVTSAFVQQTEQKRRALQIVDDCFFRRGAENGP